MKCKQLFLLLNFFCVFFFIESLHSKAYNSALKDIPENCMFCRKFIGKQLIECMNQLENDEYKFSLMKLDSIKKQRYYYLKNTLQTAKDLEKFGARFSSEEWEKIWNDFSKEEKEIFASYLGTIASTKENLDSLTTEKNVIEWIYWPFKGIVEKISKDVQWLTKND